MNIKKTQKNNVNFERKKKVGLDQILKLLES